MDGQSAAQQVMSELVRRLVPIQRFEAGEEDARAGVDAEPGNKCGRSACRRPARKQPDGDGGAEDGGAADGAGWWWQTGSLASSRQLPRRSDSKASGCVSSKQSISEATVR